MGFGWLVGLVFLTGFLCVTLAILELGFVDEASPPSSRDLVFASRVLGLKAFAILQCLLADTPIIPFNFVTKWGSFSFTKPL